MTVLFLANVGTRDVFLEDPALLPANLRGNPLPRRLGEAILQDYERYAPKLQIPLMAACVRWLLEHEKVEPASLHVHLFASDQLPPPQTPERLWLQDTIHFARLIQHFLLEGRLEWEASVQEGGQSRRERRSLRLTRSQVHIHTIAGSPADYRNMLDFFERELPRLAERVGPEGRVYLEVSGGTPAMTSMLIVSGVEVFGKRAQILYLEPEATEPYPLSIGTALLARWAREALRAQVQSYAYAVARETLATEKSLLAPDISRQELLAALLEYGQHRLAFDFARARDALNRACQHADGTVEARIRQWWRELDPTRRDTSSLIAELIHSTRILYRLGNYADFTQRLFRFQEACFRHLAERMGLRYKDKDEKRVDPEWIREVAGLGSFLDSYRTSDGQPLRWSDVELNRINLGAIADFFTQNNPTAAPLRPAVEKLHRLSAVADLRNKGLAGHGFQGVSKEDLDHAFGEDADGVLLLLEQVYRIIFGCPVGDSPYDELNKMVLSLLAS